MTTKSFFIIGASALLALSAIFCFRQMKKETNELFAMNVEAFSDGESHKGPFQHREETECFIQEGIYISYNGQDIGASLDSTALNGSASRSKGDLSVRTTKGERGLKTYCRDGGWIIFCKEKSCR